MGICSSTMLMIDGGGSRIVIYVVARISESLDAGNREGSFPYRLELSCGYKIVDHRETKSSAGRATFFFP